MSFALSQRRTDRHPVGLAIVVGLHVVLAAALLSARLVSGPAAPPPVNLVTMDPVQPAEPRHDDVLPQPKSPSLRLSVPTPDVVPDPTPDPVINAQVDDHPAVTPPSAVVASAGDDNTVHDPARVQPRTARIDAGAAQCRPAYPPAAQRTGATGTTRIRFTVDAQGRIAGSRIVHASGPSREHRLLDQAAAAALAQCPVQAGIDAQGRPIGTTTDGEYVWSLN